MGFASLDLKLMHIYHERKRTKLVPHSRKCIFLGYGIDDNFDF